MPTTIVTGRDITFTIAGDSYDAQATSAILTIDSTSKQKHVTSKQKHAISKQKHVIPKQNLVIPKQKHVISKQEHIIS